MSIQSASVRHGHTCGCHACEFAANVPEDGFDLDEPGRLDPTKTTTAQREYGRFLRGRVADLNADIRELIQEEDALGLDPDRPDILRGRWADLSDAEKAREFDEWLTGQIEADILEPHDSERVREWFRRATKRGIQQAQADLREAANEGVREGTITREQANELLEELPDPVDRLTDVEIRNFIDLQIEGARQHVESNMETFAGETRQLVTAGIAAGVGRSVLSRDIVERGQVAKSNVTSTASAEIVNTFNERELGEWDTVKADVEIDVQAEWVDSQDDRVCDLCLSLSARDWTFEEAKAFDIPGDTHPFCRCRFRITQIGDIF